MTSPIAWDAGGGIQGPLLRDHAAAWVKRLALPCVTTRSRARPVPSACSSWEKEGAEDKAEVKALDAAQLGRFLEAARREVLPESYLLFRVMALTGMRLGEALALKWDDVDLAAGRALIRRGVNRRIVLATKTRRQRSVYGTRRRADAWDVKTKAIGLQAGRERAAWSSRRSGGLRSTIAARSASSRRWPARRSSRRTSRRTACGTPTRA